MTDDVVARKPAAATIRGVAAIVGALIGLSACSGSTAQPSPTTVDAAVVKTCHDMIQGTSSDTMLSIKDYAISQGVSEAAIDARCPNVIDNEKEKLRIWQETYHATHPLNNPVDANAIENPLP